MIKISLLTIESENADPEILKAIRELLERAGVSGSVVMQAAGVEGGPTPAPTEPAGPAPRARTCPAFPPCRPCRQNAGECGWAGATKPEEKPEPAKAAEPEIEPVPAAEPPPHAPPAPAAEPTPQKAATMPSSARVLELVAQRPGINNKDLAVAIVGSSSPGDLIRLGRVVSPLVYSGRVRRAGESGRYTYHPVETQPAYPPVTRPLRVHVPEGALAPAAEPSGRVDGYTTPSPDVGSLHERILNAAKASPGITIANLAVGLLDSGSQDARRRIDFAAGPLVMAGELMRLNGGLYPKGYRGPTAPPAVLRRPAAAPAPAAAAPSNAQLYQRIVEAFAADHGCLVSTLAAELFGDGTGKSVAKLQLMLRQLVASERLEYLGGGKYRPVSDHERRGRDDEDEDEDDMESNGAAEGDALDSFEGLDA